MNLQDAQAVEWIVRVRYVAVLSVLCAVTTSWGLSAAGAQEGASTSRSSQAQTDRKQREKQLPSYADYSRRVRNVLQRQAVADSPAAQWAAVHDMCVLYSQIMRDPRYALSPTLQGFKAQLNSRLRRVKSSLEQKIARQRRAQRPSAGGLAEPLPEEAALDGALGATVDLAIESLGGPSWLFAGAWSQWPAEGAAGGAPVWDYGPALVELIQRTISPSYWDVNGGPGTIIYYRPAMALVVRATPGMLMEVGDGLDKLRGR